MNEHELSEWINEVCTSFGTPITQIRMTQECMDELIERSSKLLISNEYSSSRTGGLISNYTGIPIVIDDNLKLQGKKFEVDYMKSVDELLGDE